MKSDTEALLAQRGEIYGDAVETHNRIALMWSGILNTDVSALDVALCMAALKLVRAECSPQHKDNYDDAHGYVAIAEMIVDSDVVGEPAVVSRTCAECSRPENRHGAAGHCYTTGTEKFRP